MEGTREPRSQPQRHRDVLEILRRAKMNPPSPSREYPAIRDVIMLNPKRKPKNSGQGPSTSNPAAR